MTSGGEQPRPRRIAAWVGVALAVVLVGGLTWVGVSALVERGCVSNVAREGWDEKVVLNAVGQPLSTAVADLESGLPACMEIEVEGVADPTVTVESVRVERGAAPRVVLRVGDEP